MERNWEACQGASVVFQLYYTTSLGFKTDCLDLQYPRTTPIVSLALNERSCWTRGSAGEIDFRPAQVDFASRPSPGAGLRIWP